MIKILLKKQLIELSTPFVINRKTGRKKTGKQMIPYILLFVYLFGLLAFNGVNNAQTILSAFGGMGNDWIYFALMFCLASALGVMLAIIITYSGIFMAKDNDLLLSMPIPVGAIVVSRILNSYIWAFAFTIPGLLPATMIYFIRNGFSFSVLAGGLFGILFAPLLACDIAAFAAWIVGMATKKVVKKNGVFIVLLIIFTSAYSFLNSFIMSTLSTRSFEQVNARFGDFFKAIKVFGEALSGKPSSLIMVVFASLILTFAFYLLLRRSFIGIVTTKVGGKKKEYKQNMIATATPERALLKKEFKHLFSNGVYLANTGIGLFFAVIAAIAIAIFGGKIKASIPPELMDESFVNMIAAAALFGLGAMNYMTSVSYTLEGKSMWILKSMPVDYRAVIDSKVALQLYSTTVPVVLLFLSGIIYFPLDPRILAGAILFAYACSAIGLLIDLKWGSTKYINETVAVKQNPLVLLALGINMVLGSLSCVPYFVLRNKVNINFDTYLTFLVIFYAAIAYIARTKVRTTGVSLLEEAD